MSTTNFKLSFITVNYNGFADTRDLLLSIISAKFTFTYEVIVIDNGSKEDEYSFLKEEFPCIKGRYLPTNLGFAGGNNVGLQMTNAEFLFFVNNDTFFPSDANKQILEMLNFMEQKLYVGGITPKIMYTEPKNLIQFAGCTSLSKITLRNKQIGYQEWDKGQYDRNSEIPYMHGAAMLVPHRVIRDVGMMSELFFLYYEELDWSCQIRKKYQLFYFAGAHIYHKESASTGADSPLKIFYLTRNRLLFAYRNRYGIFRILSILYLVAIANPIKICKFMGMGKWKHLRATWLGMLSASRLFVKNNRS
jgi:GT2 family glycosyltransferase